jgi:CelD/BcsL family acetyltransferase involved in cellulose biosynthesis
LGLQVNLIDNSTDLKAIKDSWDELHDSIPPPQGHPFNCFSWLFPYAMHLERQGGSLQIFAVSDGDKLVGIAPLQVLSKSLLGFRRIQFLGHFFSDYCDFIYRKDYEEVVGKILLRHLKSRFGNRAVFDLNRIHESSPTTGLLRTGVQALGGQFYEIPWDKAPALNLIDGDSARTDTLGSILSKKHCRQRIREMEKLGTIRFSIVRAESGLESHLERLFYYHRLRWHEKKTYVHSMSEDMQKVYRSSIYQMAKKGHAELIVLTVNDLPYAYAVALKKEQHFYYLIPTHNIFAPYSPGTSLVYHIFKYVKDADYQELDFSIGEEPYKNRFSNTVRQNQRVFFTFDSFPAFARALKLIDTMRSNDLLMENVRAWRTRSGRVNYNLSDYLSRGLAGLKRLDYNGLRPHLQRRQVFPKGSCLIYRLRLADVTDSSGRQNQFQIQKIPVTQAIQFICEFHRCDSPAIWGDLLRREIEGCECYGTFIDNQLIHTSWVTDQKSVLVTEIGQSLKLEDGECCVFDCNTLAEFRGREAYSQTLRYISRIKKRSGYKSAYIYTLSSNVSSIKGIENAGFEMAEIRQHRAPKHALCR